MNLTSVSTQNLSDETEATDLFLCACGYESRAIYVASEVSRNAKKKVALGFAAQHEHRYEQNKRWFQGEGFEVTDIADEDYEKVLANVISDLCESTRSPQIVVDISCMNRARMARLVRALQIADVESLVVSFAYNLAEFSAPSEDIAPTSVAEPVIPEFSGWTNYPEKPPAAIIGLGYEQSRAIGIVDHLEINNAAWAFLPRGPIDDYSMSVDLANGSLFQMIGVEGRRLYYEVMDPSALFRELNALVDLLKQIYNPILIPFGPKIFALVALLVGCMHQEVGVWRVSSGVLEPAVDRTPSVHTTVLKTVFSK